ncbi:MAG: MBOAT family O-acyltransferase [Cyanobacteriota bacterium]|nr:MBOAT family O-acyltransferase [Cyanobacteriota bacterium]
MTFLSLLYGLFLLSIIFVYWGVRQRPFRLWLLLAASIIFYGSVQLQSVPLLLGSAWVNFKLGQEIGEGQEREAYKKNWQLSNKAWEAQQQKWQRRRIGLLIAGIAFNVIVLLSFKYGSLLFSPESQLASRWADSWLNPYFIAPLGISFFTFECLAYLIDVYRGAPVTQDLLQFASYKFFFPKLISGPITRYHQWSEQFSKQEAPDVERVSEGLWLIASGAIKKGLLADNLGIYVDLCFENLQRAGSGDLWLATLAYGFQLYLDFSGYVDIARGSAMLLGWTLPRNFDFPYMTTSIADFWRRWHMTLGDWLRNYLYFPLGGSRQGLLNTCMNLMLVMLVAGIWHGSAGTRLDPLGYLVWGGYHGLALVAHRLTDTLSGRASALKAWWQSVPGTVVAWVITQGMVFSSWIFFRLPNLQDSGWVFRNLWNTSADAQFAQKVYVESLGMARSDLVLALSIIIGWMGLAYWLEKGLKLKLNWPVEMLLVPVCFYVVWLLAPDSLPYIYFDF